MAGPGSWTWRARRRAALGMAVLLAACVLVVAPPAGPGTKGRAGAASPRATDGSYAIVDAAGGVMTFGGAGYEGDTLEVPLRSRSSAARPTPTAATGSWRPTAGCSPSAMRPSGARREAWRSTSPSSAWRPTPDGGGYWLVASDGGIFTFGDAQFWGSTGSIRLNKPIVGMAATHGWRRLLARRLRRRHLQPSATPGSWARPGASRSTSPSSAWRPRPTAAGTGSSPPTVASSPTGTPSSGGRRAASP